MQTRIARLRHRALVRVGGPDRIGWLQGLLTRDVTGLQPGELRFGALLTPQGKFLFDLFIGDDPEAILLEAEADRCEALIARLSAYRLRAKVEISAEPAPVFARWPGGGLEVAAAWRADPRLPALGWRAWGEPGASPDADEADYRAFLLARGVPDPARDCEPDHTWPIEANFDLLGGIDFHKGCFIGQETTSRMRRRGQVRNRMLPVVFDGAAPQTGAEVLNGELRAGIVTSAAPGRAMALLRLDRIDAGELTIEGQPVRVERPAWFEEA